MLLSSQKFKHSFPFLEPCKNTRENSAIFVSQLSKPFRLIVLKGPQVGELEAMVNIPAFSLFLAFLKTSQIRVFLSRQFSLAVDLVVMESSLVVITVIPLVVSITLLHSIDEVTLEEGIVIVNLSCLSVWKVILPSSFVKDLISGELTVAHGFVVLDASAIEAAVVLDEESVIAFRDALVEAALVDGSIIVDDPSEPVWQTIFPFSLIVRSELEQIVEVQLHSNLLRRVLRA